MDGFGAQSAGTLLNKDCMERQMDHFWFEIHKLIYTILR